MAQNNLNIVVGGFGENVQSERIRPIYIKSTNIIDKKKVVKKQKQIRSLCKYIHTNTMVNNVAIYSGL